MSPALSLSFTHLPICKSQDISKDTSSNSNNSALIKPNFKLTKRQLLNSTGLGLLGGLSNPDVGVSRAEPEAPIESASSRLSYTRFLTYLEQGVVRKVDLFENGTVAIAEIYNPALEKIQRVKVQLPGLPAELVRKLKEKNVDFAAHPVDVNWGLAVLDFLANFGFPLLLLGSLFLRTPSPNNPGGPSLPFGLGR